MEKLQSKKKTRQTRQSSKDNKDKQIESEMDGTNIGEHITYDVLRMILEYSNIRDLTRAAMVCRTWNEAAKKEIQTRIKPQNILLELEPVEAKERNMKTFTDKLLIKPSIGLLFVGRQARTSLYYRSCITDGCLCDRVPHQTDCITIWNYGLVYDNLEIEGDNVCGLFLPKIPGVKIKSFNIDERELAQFRTTTHQRSREKLARKFLKISPKEENIKSIILFTNQQLEDHEEHSPSDDAKKILKAVLSQQTNNKDKISVWGGITSKLIICSSVPNEECDHEPSLAGISICGAGISTWSIVIDRRIKTQAQLEKELTSFRDVVKLQKYSVGFMFACCGRGEEWYAAKNVEPVVFRKFFPNVPLVGSFGGGEFGVSTVPRGCSKCTGIVHEYSTIFLIVSYGSMRNMK